MMTPRRVKIMVLMHAGICTGGLLVHGRLHSPADSLYFWWASPVSLFSLTLISVLYCRPSTAAWGFMLNAGTVLIGTIGMLYYSVLTIEKPLTLYNVFFKSALPGIFIAWIKFPVSLVILRSMRPLRGARQQRGCAGSLK